jgi:hypothetical protein
MNKVSLDEVLGDEDGAGEKPGIGETPEVGYELSALDALTAQLGDDETGMVVILQSLRPDGFFTAAQQHRLEELMTRWRTARDSGDGLAEQEQAELQSLVEAELDAARRRAEVAVREIQR